MHGMSAQYSSHALLLPLSSPLHLLVLVERHACCSCCVYMCSMCNECVCMRHPSIHPLRLSPACRLPPPCLAWPGLACQLTNTHTHTNAHTATTHNESI